MSLLIALLQALVLFAVAPLLSGIVRVARARLHNRRGPGVLQEYRDILKLLGRQSVGPDASGWVFRLTPYVMVGVMLTIATALPVVTVDSPLPVLGDLITLIYLFAIARFFFAISGLDTGSPFTALGSSREAMLGVLVEPILLLGLWVAAQVAGSTHISAITDTLYHWPAARSIPLILALCACAFATFIEMGKLPFDLAEAEQELVDMLLSTPNMEQRTVGIGRLDPEIARDFSNVGPMVRASGHARDTRADHPFVGYGLLPMEVHSEQGCDVISRLKVRINEVYTALNMIDFGLDNLPGGPLMVEGFTYIPHRFALGFSEAPRGDDIHWSMTGDNQKLYRWRCRAATYANWPTLRYMLRGNTVSDAPLIIGSLDPCYSCTDRMTVVDVRKKKSKVVPYKELERYSIERKNSPLK